MTNDKPTVADWCLACVKLAWQLAVPILGIGVLVFLMYWAMLELERIFE